MKIAKIALIAGALVTVGVIAAISAPGPRDGLRGWAKLRSLTADEYDTRTRERFARYDKNGDGIIDVPEITAAFAAMTSHGSHGRRAAEGEAERFVRAFGDKDGKVIKTAFLAEVKRRFGQLDLNNDGKITDDDLPPMLRGRGILKADAPPMPGPMGRMIAELRKAGSAPDGSISLDAVLAAETNRFDSLDRNKDGVVDKADAELIKKEMVDYGVKRFLHSYGADADGKVTRDQFYKVAKEQFARLDRKGEGRIEVGPPDGGRSGGWWFGDRRGPGLGARDGGIDGGADFGASPAGPPPPRN